MNTSIRVVIPDVAATRLAELARREFRSPPQQAAVLVLAGLKNAGLDADERPENTVETSDASLGGSQPASRAHVSDDLPVNV